VGSKFTYYEKLIAERAGECAELLEKVRHFRSAIATLQDVVGTLEAKIAEHRAKGNELVMELRRLKADEYSK